MYYVATCRWQINSAGGQMALHLVLLLPMLHPSTPEPRNPLHMRAGAQQAKSPLLLLPPAAAIATVAGQPLQC